ncbi:tyrosine-type recombinase/integrase [Candidatus Poribacteria bacterium]|nr:tyrosine-type recombinase/integrase [Candidatus Poribacteria bacterium]
MDDLLQDYRDYLYDQDKSEQTIKAYMTDLSSFSRWFQQTTGEPLNLENITPMEIIDYRNAMLDWDKKPSTINRSLISISSFCQWAQQNDLIASNPAEGIRSVAEEPLAPRALERKEQLALLRAVRRSGNLRDLAIITMLLHTGIRVGELCNLRVSDIRISTNSNMITVREGKGTKRRNVPLNSTAIGVLKDFIKSFDNNEEVIYIAGSNPERERFLFYGQKRMPLTDRGVRYVIQKYAYKAKIDNLSPHVFRHTCAKNLIDAGQSIDRVAKILGHSNINTTSVYTIPTERDLHITMESISQD